MFLATAISQPIPAFDVLLIALNAVAPIVAVIWIKVVLYRRREAQDRGKALRLNNQQYVDHERTSPRRRPVEMRRTLPREFQSKRPLGLYAVSKPNGSQTSANTTRGTSRTKPAQSPLHCASTTPVSTHHITHTIL